MLVNAEDQPKCIKACDVASHSAYTAPADEAHVVQPSQKAHIFPVFSGSVRCAVQSEKDGRLSSKRATSKHHSLLVACHSTS